MQVICEPIIKIFCILKQKNIASSILIFLLKLNWIVLVFSEV